MYNINILTCVVTALMLTSQMIITLQLCGKLSIRFSLSSDHIAMHLCTGNNTDIWELQILLYVDDLVG